MNSPFNCEVHYIKSPHLHQIYDGFRKLEQNKVINLSFKEDNNQKSSSHKPLLTVIFEKKYKIIYDTLDGFNWFDGPEIENLEHFQKKYTADFYFKRSYSKILEDYAPNDCRVFPLGFNYNLKPQGELPSDIRQKVKLLLQNTPVLSNYFIKDDFPSQYFEQYPVPNDKIKILFFARLWSPKDVDLDILKEERYDLNNNRIRCIKACKSEFKKQFTGGLQDNSYAREIANDLIMPASLTKKEMYLDAVKTHDICIATTGLFDSIGWKFGEYVAASRAIVSEPLRYDVPGNFDLEKNYLSFTDSNELINNIHSLINDPSQLRQMMLNNYRYYNNYLRPDSLILNTLLKVKALTQ